MSFEAEKISYSYRDREVLSDISLSIQPGELMVLVGSNGAGKTTLLRTLAGQLRPRFGDVSICDQSITRLSSKEISKQLSLMPQHEEKSHALEIYDVVALGRTPHVGWWMPLNPTDESIIKASIEAVGLWEMRHRTVDTLSGGEWRRMILARSLAQKATVLLLDEPTSGLDIRFQFECLEHVRYLVKQNHLMAIITLHDLNQAALFADRIAIMANRIILAVGTPSEVLIPSIIQEAFGIETTVLQHPQHPAPVIVPVRPQQRLVPDPPRILEQ